MNDLCEAGFFKIDHPENEMGVKETILNHTFVALNGSKHR